MKHKLIIIILLICAQTFQLSAQQIKYKDVYELILTDQKEKSYTILLAYQKQNPGFANTYFQLGLIAKDWAKSYNPFTEYSFVKLFIYNTKLYFNLARHSMQEESKANYKYYENADINAEKGKIKEEDINTYIDKKVEEIAFFELNINKIINSYNKTVESYNKCIEIFKEINSEFSLIKNIYLSEDEDFIKKIDALEIFYDSTLIYFAKYKQAIKEYPIGNYNQEYTLKQIVTYRLDGLTSSNFLQNDITIWDYKTWVHNLKNLRNTEIAKNKAEIEKAYSQIVEKTNNLSAENYSDEIKPFVIDEKLIFKIGKYDHNSLLIRLFKFFEAKINFMILYRNSINNPQNTDFISDKKAAAYYKNLLDKKIETDTLNHVFASEIKHEQIRKYQNFYMQNFGGLSGLKNFSFQQELFLNAQIQSAFNNLGKRILMQNYIERKRIFADSLSNINLLFGADTVNAKIGDYIVKNYNISDDKSVFFTGNIVNQNKNSKTFFGTINPENKIQLLKIINSPDTAQFEGKLTVKTDNGFLVIQTASSKIHKTVILTKSDINGNITENIVVKSNKEPQFAQYDEINNSLILVCADEISQSIKNINLNDNSEIFNTQINMKGKIVSVNKTENNFLVVNNYTEYTDFEGISRATVSPQTTNVFLSILNNNGKIISQKNYSSPISFAAVKAIKINSNNINIVGIIKPENSDIWKQLETKLIFYSIINTDGNEIYNNRHN